MGKLGVILGSGAAGLTPTRDDVVSLDRHRGAGGEDYLVPHLIDHEAHLRELADAGCDRILGVSSVGSLRPELLPGSFVIPDDFIALDVPPLTKITDADAHVAPGFDSDWRRQVVDAFRGATEIVDGGVYWQVVGPRLETPAEVRMMAPHAHVVGMTSASECIAAAELHCPYACVCVVDNLANGVTSLGLTAADIREGQQQHRPELEAVLASALAVLTGESS
jgi:5'-methylthioadenosine phosphorylase